MFRRTLIGSTFALAGLLMVGRPARAVPAARAHDAPPGVRIWTDHGDVYRDGERMQVYFRTENDAYVTVLRVETSGLVRVLFPRSPDDPNLAHGGETYVVPGVDDRDAFEVDDAPGIGYVFAVASADPFVYDEFTQDARWSFQDINNLSDGRIHGDPYASLQDLVQHIMPAGYADYDTHLLPYYVNQHFDYPRFLCYDCHTYTPYASWDPYAAWCPQYSLAVYYNPFYFYPSYWYPTRYYRGTNVVYVRPGMTGSQYVFRSRSAESAPYTVYRDRRGVGVQAPDGRGIRGVDVGGVGSIPAPGGRRVVGGGFADPGGRRVVGAAFASPAARGAAGSGYTSPAGGMPGGTGAGSGRRFIADPRAAASTSPRVIGPDASVPSRGEMVPAQPRRGVYIEPGIPSPRTLPPAGGAVPPATREAPRYIPSSAPGADARPGSGYGPRPVPATVGAPAPRAVPSRAYGRPAPEGGMGHPAPAPAVGRTPAARPAPPALVRRRP